MKNFKEIIINQFINFPYFDFILKIFKKTEKFIFACENNKLYQQKHPYNVTINKDIRIVNDSSFSIEKISCKSCGGSFDAEYVKNCPYCNSEFNLINYDYVISEVK